MESVVGPESMMMFCQRVGSARGMTTFLSEKPYRKIDFRSAGGALTIFQGNMKLLDTDPPKPGVDVDISWAEFSWKEGC